MIVPLKEFDGFTPGMSTVGIPLFGVSQYGANRMPEEDPVSRYLFYNWAMEDDDFDEGHGSRTRPALMTVYFRIKETDGRIPFRCLESFGAKVPIELSMKIFDMSKSWQKRRAPFLLGSREVYSLDEAHGLIFPYLREVLKEVYDVTEEDVVDRNVLGFYVGMGSREAHLKAHLNLVGMTKQYMFPPGWTGTYLRRWEDVYRMGRKKFWSMPNLA